MVSFGLISKKLDAELQVNRLGKKRQYKFVLNELGEQTLAHEFFVSFLGWKKHEVNAIRYFIDYYKRKYALKKLNSAKIDKSN